MSTNASEVVPLPTASLHLIPSPHHPLFALMRNKDVWQDSQTPKSCPTNNDNHQATRWVSSGYNLANGMLMIMNEVFGLKLWDGTPHPGQHTWLHVINMAHCGIGFHHFTSQINPSFSTEKSQLAGSMRSKAILSKLPPE